MINEVLIMTIVTTLAVAVAAYFIGSKVGYENGVLAEKYKDQKWDKYGLPIIEDIPKMPPCKPPRKDKE